MGGNSGAWQPVEGAAGMHCAILRAVICLFGQAGTTSASLNIGTSSVSNSSSGNLINSFNVNSNSPGFYDNISSQSQGTLGKPIQTLWAGEYVTVTSLIDTVSTTPVSASLYIEYMPVAAVPAPGI